MDIGEAIKALKDGKRIHRTSWPDGMSLILVPGSSITVQADRPLGAAAPHLVGEQAEYSAHIDLCVAFTEGIMIGPKTWVDPDVLADDWEIYSMDVVSRPSQPHWTTGSA